VCVSLSLLGASSERLILCLRSGATNSCSVLQQVAVCCSTLQYVAVRFSMCVCVSLCFFLSAGCVEREKCVCPSLCWARRARNSWLVFADVRQIVAVCCSVLQYIAMLQYVAVCCSMLQ